MSRRRTPHSSARRQLSPADTTALRAAALTAERLGDPGTALSLAQHAADLRPNDPANLEVLAYVAGSANEPDARRDALRELVTREPWLTSSADWTGLGEAMPVRRGRPGWRRGARRGVRTGPPARGRAGLAPRRDRCAR